MKKRVIGALLLAVPAILSSCIKNEPLNPEADILTFNIPAWGIALTDQNLTKEDISLFVPKNLLTNYKQTPLITITDRATIVPAIGKEQDFSSEVKYTVTSEDGSHQREFTFRVNSTLQAEYDFEYWDTNKDADRAYQTPYEMIDGQKQTIWDSSNTGVAVYRYKTDPADYPTHSTTEMVKSGKKAAELVTMTGPGNILETQYIPVIAGSLFTGSLSIIDALTNPLTATRFGILYTSTQIPDSLMGYYYYRAGTGDYISVNPDKPMSSISTPHSEKQDSCSLYAILYETTNSVPTLDGTNILTNPNIVAKAILPDQLRGASPGEGLQYFSIPFVFPKGKNAIDFINKKYKIAIVFSSSYNGDKYAGTPGSRLIVDDVKLVVQ